MRKAGVKRVGHRHNGWKITVLLAGGFLFVVGLYFFYVNIYKVVPAFSEMTWEYGDRVSQDIADYLVGTDWSVHLGELDLSQVDEGSTGIYQAVVHHGTTLFTYSVIIQDTIPPEILWRGEPVYLAAGVSYAVGEVIAGVADADPQTEAFFLYEGECVTEIRFDRVGKYEVEILARDRSGNEAGGQLFVIVDTAPVISGLHNYYVIPGSEPDYLEGITVWDDADGDLTEEVWVDDSKVELDTEGTYPLHYLAEDGYGLETVETAWVMVAVAEKLQELIGSRQISRSTSSILGAFNIYDAGVSGYEDMEETLEYMRPTLVHLYHATGKGGYTSGSGYIVEITEDVIYICSNSHVLEKYDEWDVYFFDGTKLSGKVLGRSDSYDVGVVTVEAEEVPEELLERLMTVHIDKTYWESLDEQRIEVALERVDREGGLMHVTMGNLVKTKQRFFWYDQKAHTEVTVELVHGDSGSALMDGYGNLICMAYSFTSTPRRNWCIPLDGILECYEEITGRMPYTY